MLRPLLAILLPAALLAGCGKNATEPPAAVSGVLPPAVISTSPAPRSTSAAYDGEIWAQFDRPLDGRTVSALTVFLKLDGQRITSTVNYDGITRRIFIRPASTLQLQRTYTAEFSTGVKGLDGVPLPEGVYFQFTTNSLRRVVYDYPADDALEGPASGFGWGGTQGPTNNLMYDVYGSTDSLAVATRSAPVLQRSVFTRFLPSIAWPLGARVYWAITAENLTTHERENAPVHSFRVIDAGVVLDSVVVRAADHGSIDPRNRNAQSCNFQTLPCGPGANAAMHWGYGTVPANVRFASATLKVWTLDTDANKYGTALPTVWMAQNDWLPCSINANSVPFAEPSGLLAGAASVDGIEGHFDSVRLTAFFEAQYRRRTLLLGTLLRSQQLVYFNAPTFPDVSRVPQVLIRFYRLP